MVCNPGWNADFPAEMVAAIAAKQADILDESFTVFQGLLMEQAGQKRYAGEVRK